VPEIKESIMIERPNVQDKAKLKASKIYRPWIAPSGEFKGKIYKEIQKSWTILIDPDEVDKLFIEHTHQAELISALYRMLYPNMDEIEKVNTYPYINETTHYYLGSKFIAFDKKHHPDILPGGAWMNWGFACDTDLEDWEVHISGYTVKEE